MPIEHEVVVETDAAVAARFDQYDTRDIWQKDKDHFIHPWTTRRFDRGSRPAVASTPTLRSAR
ncbi:MAG: hypothetical protein QF653_00920 [Acidimicrobiales bacterium]|jgi:hypothetical protein|nr:hypothetical protein [Acidimicrobiales bacterium]|tara:strand:- start:76 stop:264 length:189 start_codon:yes stop_codon:yes gene_type:complete